MLLLPAYDQIGDVTIYRDSDREDVFYALPNVPRLRYGANGKPVFQFLKYREPVPLESGDQGGGYVQFDTEFTIPQLQRDRIRDLLQERVDRKFRDRGQQPPRATLGVPQWVDDGAQVQLITMQESPTGFVRHIAGAGKPSLMGSNIASFALDLSQRGSTLLWEAFQMANLPVAVAYELKFLARLPSMEMRVWLHAHQLATFWEQIEKDESIWHDDSFVHRRREFFSRNHVGDVQIVDWPSFGDDPAEAEKFKKQVIEMGWRMLEDHINAALEEKLPPVTERGDLEDFDNITRDFVQESVTDLDIYLKRDSVVMWPINPQATLEGFLNTPGPNGERPRKEDFFKEISLDDPFFRTLRVNVRCNADFERDPIHSVKSTLNYAQEVESFLFTDSSTSHQFRRFLDQALGRRYRWSAEVNYRGSDRVFQVPPESSDSTELVLNVGALGLLKVEVVAGDVDWTVVDQVQVQLRYGDTPNGVPFEDTVRVLREDQKTQSYERILFAPRRLPYQWRAIYFLRQGQQIERDLEPSDSPILIVNDVFQERLNVMLAPAGSFERMSQVLVDLDYTDPAHDYRVQKSFQLADPEDAFMFSVPLWDDGPTQFRYRYQVAYRDGHIEEHDWEQADGSTTLLLGEVFADTLEVREIITDLVDFDNVRLVQLTLRYSDPANGIEDREDFVLSRDRRPANLPWRVAIKDLALRSYTLTATYFMSDGSRRAQGPMEVADEVVILDLPTA